MSSPRLTEDDLAQFHRNMGKVGGRESIGSESYHGESAKTSSSPRKRSVDALPVRSMPEIGVSPSPKINRYAPYRNKLEWNFAQALVIEKHAGLIRDWTYESMTLKLSVAGERKRGDYHRTDFLIWHLDGTIELAQTKGWHKNLSASLKGLRWAAQKNPWFRFTIWRYQDGWQTELVEA